MTEHATCSKCKTEKPVGCFPKRHGRPSGLHSHCYDCRNEYTRNRRASCLKEMREYERAMYRLNIDRKREVKRNNMRKYRAQKKALELYDALTNDTAGRQEVVLAVWPYAISEAGTLACSVPA